MRRSIPFLALLGAALLSACSSGSRGPSWVRLADGFTPAALSETPAGWGETRIEQAEVGKLWLRERMPREAWRQQEGLPGIWIAARPGGNPLLSLAEQPPARLVSEAGEYARVRLDDLDSLALAEGQFLVFADEVFLKPFGGGEPPAELRWSTQLSLGREENGTWRYAFARWSGDGVPLVAGGAESLEVEARGPSRLTFGTLAVAVRAGALADPDELAGRVRFRISSGDDVLFESLQSVTLGGVHRTHTVELPEGLRGGALRFEVEGARAACAFTAPVLGPLDVGTWDERPWEGALPAVLLLLADTFRADGMAAYGGELGLTPNLDALGEQSLLFERTWSPAVWTLPSQGSMMTGVQPERHGATRAGRAIPREAVTLAERLRDAGYRTVAVTDSAILSRTYGFDQGFETFEEYFDDAWRDTQEVALKHLDADDGRPLFLFVQSYRAHRPYRVEDETRAAHGERLGIEGEFDPVVAVIEDDTRDDYVEWDYGEPLPAAARPTVERLEALYRGGVIDVDRGVGSLLDALRERAFLDDAYLVFTSDHGEAFGEHEILWHFGGVWEEQVRVPLLIHGPGLDPRRVPHSASLVDLPRTITALLDVRANELWEGEPLHTLNRDRPSLTFECGAFDLTRMAVVDGDLKLLAATPNEGAEPPRLLHAFDLAADPGERSDLLEGSRRAELEAAFGERLPALQEALELRFQPGSVDLSAEALAALHGIGYGGE